MGYTIGVDDDLVTATHRQLDVHRAIRDGARGGVPTPFLAMLDAPGLANAIQAVGLALRFEGSLADDRRELAILAVAAEVGCRYEWRYHEPIARRAGVSETTIDATLQRTAPLWCDPADAALIIVCRHLVARRTAPPELLATLASTLSRAELTELVAIAGYYALLASFLFVSGREEPGEVCG